MTAHYAADTLAEARTAAMEAVEMMAGYGFSAARIHAERTETGYRIDVQFVRDGGDE